VTKSLGVDGIANVNLLIAADRDMENVDAMPRMSVIPTNIERVNGVVDQSAKSAPRWKT
jgi:hypothetical protein